MTRQPPAPEFSRPVPVDRLPDSGQHERIEADAAERAALARRFDIPDVTLEPVPEHVAESFTIRFLPPERVADWEERHRRMGEEGELVDPDAPDPPEVLVGNVIDVGEAVAEHLALALDPYPRSPGASFAAPPPEDEPEEPARPNPFAVLKGRRNDA